MFLPEFGFDELFVLAEEGIALRRHLSFIAESACEVEHFGSVLIEQHTPVHLLYRHLFFLHLFSPQRFFPLFLSNGKAAP